MLRTPRRIVGFTLAVLAVALSPARAAADEEELVLMREPASFTDVVDAFDEHDVFDVNISVGYLHTWEFGRVQREQNGPAAADGRMSQHWQDVADYSHEVNQLVFGLDVGIYRDLAVYARLPLLLSDDRSLSRVSGSDPMIAFDRRAGDDPTTPEVEPQPLFDLPFRSPTRSGVDYLAAGLAWSILNQQRDPHVPTWVIMLEGRFNLGEPMRACSGSNCLTTQVGPDGTLVRGSSAGVGRGTNALRAETRGSFRYEYMEPYAGLAFQIEWPGYGSNQFLPSGALAGYINQLPPIQGRLTVGTAIMPWEDRQHWQRFSIDLRFTADYFSEGHDYSPLFDALGSSMNRHLTQATLEGQPDAERGSEGLRSVNFYGLTDTQAHARLGWSLTLEMQAARYVRFSLSTTIFHSPSYVITQADACNPNVDMAPRGDSRLHGTCRSGIINPHHRTAIDLPGQRFRMEGLTQVDISAFVTAQF